MSMIEPHACHRSAFAALVAVMMSAALLFGAAPAAAEKSPRRVQAELVFDRAKALASAEQYDAAAQLFEEAYKLDPSWSKPLLNVALCQRRTKDFNGAKATYRRVLKSHKDDPAALFGWAETERLMGRRDQARDLFLKYLVKETRPGQKKLLDYATLQIKNLGGAAPPAAAAPKKDPPPAPKKVERTPPPPPPPPPASPPQKAAPPAPPQKAPPKAVPIGPAERPAERPSKAATPPTKDVGSTRGKSTKADVALSHNTLMVLDIQSEGVSRKVSEAFSRALREELVKSGGLNVLHENEAIGKLVKAGKGLCQPAPQCLAQSSHAAYFLRTKLSPKKRKTEAVLELVRTDTLAVIADVKGTLSGKGSEVAFVREGLSELLAEHALAKTEGGAVTRRVAAAGDGAAEDDTEGGGRQVASADEGDERRARSKKKRSGNKRKSKLREADEADERREALAPEAKVAEEDEGFGALDIAKHTWRWGLTGAGAATVAGGLGLDLLLPSSGNYKLDAGDFVFPVSIVLGAALVGVAFLLNPFSWFGE